MRQLTERRVYNTTRRIYFGWDLRQSDWEIVHWQRSPKLSSETLVHWPYRIDTAEDLKPDFCIVVQGDPSDELLTHWLEEDERGAATNVAAPAAGSA